MLCYFVLISGPTTVFSQVNYECLKCSTSGHTTRYTIEIVGLSLQTLGSKPSTAYRPISTFIEGGQDENGMAKKRQGKAT